MSINKTRLLLFASSLDPDSVAPESVDEIIFLDAQGANSTLLFESSLNGAPLAQVIDEDRIGEHDPQFLRDHLLPPGYGVWAAEFETSIAPPMIVGEIEWVFLSPPLADLDQWEVSLRPQRPIIGAIPPGGHHA